MEKDEKIESPYADKRQKALEEADMMTKNSPAMEQFLTSLDNMTLQLEFTRRWVDKQTNDRIALIEESDKTEDEKKKLTAASRVQIDKVEKDLETHLGFVEFIRSDLGL